MAMPQIGAHQQHLHQRKRLYQNLEPIPHPDAWKRYLDKFMYFVSVVGPLSVLPQVYQVYTAKNAADLSIWSWGTFCVFNIIWLTYGLVHKEAPIIITNTLLVLLNGAVAVAIILYS